jgi:hypothetical protein
VKFCSTVLNCALKFGSKFSYARRKIYDFAQAKTNTQKQQFKVLLKI